MIDWTYPGAAYRGARLMKELRLHVLMAASAPVVARDEVAAECGAGATQNKCRHVLIHGMLYPIKLPGFDIA